MSHQDPHHSAEIISLSAFRPGQKVNALRLVEGYWTALRDDGELPKRSQVSPRGLSDVLENVFILERVAPGVARFRIAGSVFTHLTGMDVRGVPISAFFRTSGRKDIAAALEACFDTPTVVEMKLIARSLQRAPAVTGHMIFLPMQCDLGRTSRVLGAVHMDAPLISDAYRLEMEGCSVRPVYDQPARPGPLVAAEEPAPFKAAPRLELVHTDSPA